MPSPRVKRLKYRAWHRGTRELDLVLGRFADDHLAAMGPVELDAFEALLAASDPDLHDWILVGVPAPASFDAALLGRLRASIGTDEAGGAA